MTIVYLREALAKRISAIHRKRQLMRIRFEELRFELREIRSENDELETELAHLRCKLNSMGDDDVDS